MSTHDILGRNRPSMGRCTGARAFAAAGGDVMYWRQRMNPSKRFGRLAHIEDPTTPGEGGA